MNSHLDALLSLAEHLARRRSAVLRAWREAIDRDVALTTGRALPRRELHDHVPAALIAFERCLADGECAVDPTAGPATIDAANAHGIHRWQQGYDLREVVRELGHLNRVLVAEMDGFAIAQAAAPAAMATARRLWADAYATGVEQSTSQFFALQQLEAAGHVKDLERAMGVLTDVEQQRAALWQQVAHDLRGNVGVVAAATQALRLKPEAIDRFTSMLERNVESLRHLLDDVTSLTRLQAGAEDRQLDQVDVSALFEQLCEGLQAFALQRRLYLRSIGPDTPLVVHGDAVKIRRIVQNLVLNALKYTQTGGVELSWSAGERADDKRWWFVVADTGPGIAAAPSSPIAAALAAATEVSLTVQDGAALTGLVDSVAEGAVDAQAEVSGPGEGIGLSIVKRLAELLDATVEVTSAPDSGTRFRVLLPKGYNT